MKNVKRAKRQKRIKVRSREVVKLRVGMTAGRDPAEEIVSVVGKETAVKKERIEIVAGIDVGIETGEGAEVRVEEVAVVTGEAEVRVDEAGAVIDTDEEVHGTDAVAEVENEAEEAEAGKEDVAAVEIETGTETENGEGAAAEVEAVTRRNAVEVVIDVAAEADPEAKDGHGVEGTAWTQIDRTREKTILRREKMMLLPSKQTRSLKVLMVIRRCSRPTMIREVTFLLNS